MGLRWERFRGLAAREERRLGWSAVWIAVLVICAGGASGLLTPAVDGQELDVALLVPGILLGLGAVFALYLAFSPLLDWWPHQLDEGPSSAPQVRLSVLAAVLSDRSSHTLLWLQLKLVNHGGATVLTDWGVTMIVNGVLHDGTHIFGETPLIRMRQLNALDAATGTNPFHGELVGWIAFRVGVPYANVTDAAEQGFPLSAVVTVQDTCGHECRGEVDVLRLWNQSHDQWSE